MDLLKTEWTPAYTLHACLLSIGVLLDVPEWSSPLNCDAAMLLRCGDVRGYESLKRMYTKMYAYETMQEAMQEIKGTE